jgi:hypothetical protein
MSQAVPPGDPRIISYLTLRKAVGYLGLLLPFALAAGNWLIFSGGLKGSISGYYYTGVRGVLVGGLCVIGAFLLAYHGYDRWDSWFTNAAGIGAIGAGLFPTPPVHPSTRATIAGYCHFAFASVMFSALIVMALWLFRKTDPAAEPTRVKRLRNWVYLVCGIVMLVSLSLAGIVSLPFAAALNSANPVFWLETVAIVAFGISWLVKGQAILHDKEPAAEAARLPMAGRLPAAVAVVRPVWSWPGLIEELAQGTGVALERGPALVRQVDRCPVPVVAL